MNAYSAPRLVVNGRLKQAENVRSKVEQDIDFLTHRIAVLEAQPRPNQPVIDTYKTMLGSRRAVLKWLSDGAHAQTPPLTLTR